MAHDFNEASFTKSVSEAAFKSQISLFQQAWEGWGDQGDNRRPEQKGSSTNPFLSVLTGPIGKIGEEYMKQAQKDLDLALKQDIYKCS
jgi:hypothetical protein